MGDLFRFLVPYGNGSLLSMFEACCAISCSFQVQSLLLTAVVTIFWDIWHVKNKFFFVNDSIPSLFLRVLL